MGAAETASLVTWQGANVSFWLITLMVLVSASFAAFSHSIVRAAYSLFFTLLGVAGYYVLLGSGFLAITQVIIYVGGILVLLMFGVLLTNRPMQADEKHTARRWIMGSSVGAFFLIIVLLQIITNTQWEIASTLIEPSVSVRTLGELLLEKYLLSLEVAGMALLLCLIGAAYLVRRQER